MKSKLKTSGSPNRAHSVFASMIRASHPLLKAAVALFAFAAFLTACEGPLSIRFPLTGSVVIANTSADKSPRTGDYLSARYVRGNGIDAPSWQWFADGAAIPGATGQVYHVEDGDLGKALKVRVRYRGQTGSLDSGATVPVARGPDAICNTVFELSNWLNYPIKRDRTPLTRANSPSDPYVIELNVSSISSQLPLKKVLIDNPGIYVYIDLSGSSITSIPDYAFFDATNSIDCPTLTGITIPSGVTSIGQSAFRDCASLNRVTIPESVTSIGIGAFENCISLESVNIPSGVASIANFTFNNCPKLASVNIPPGVASIGYSAFNACTGLTYITIPDSVTSIGSWAFNGCTGLKSITIGSGVASIDGNSFSNCTNIKNVTIRTDKVATTDTNNWGTRFPVVENVTFQGVTAIGQYAFISRTTLKSVTISSGVTSIGTSAFADCAKLTSVTIPSTVTTIGQSAFNSCTALTSVTIPSSVTSIEYSVFAVSGLTSVTIPDSVTSIGPEAFNGCASLASVTIGQNVTTIGTFAFSNCPITNVTIRTNKVANTVSDNWRTRFFAVENVTFQSVTSIDTYAFYSCTSLKSVTIGSGVTSIGEQAFGGCSGLTSVSIPSSVTTIGINAFRSCSSLTSVTIPSSVTSIENFAFVACTALANLTIGQGVTSIGNYAFQDCAALTSIIIPARVASIGMQAFDLCQNLTSVTFAAGSNIADANFGSLAFPEGGSGGGNSLKTAYSTGKAGTYTRAANGTTWTKS